MNERDVELTEQALSEAMSKIPASVSDTDIMRSLCDVLEIHTYKKEREANAEKEEAEADMMKEIQADILREYDGDDLEEIQESVTKN